MKAKRHFDESGPLERSIREIHVRGFDVLEREFEWTSGQRMRTYYEALELHCRLQPYNVLARAWQQGCDEKPIGRLALFPPGKQYHARATIKNETVRTVVCRFDIDWVSEVTGRDVSWGDLDPETMMDIQHPHIERAMRRIADEIARPHFGTERLIEALSIGVAIDLVRHFTSEAIDQPGVGHQLSPRRLERIHELVNSVERNTVTSDDIAIDLGMSVSYLRRVFRNTTGQTLYNYLEQARIAKACALLTETNVPLKVISFLTGFAQQSTFSYAFKRKTGLTPSEYRARKLL